MGSTIDSLLKYSDLNEDDGAIFERWGNHYLIYRIPKVQFGIPFKKLIVQLAAKISEPHLPKGSLPSWMEQMNQDRLDRIKQGEQE